jgi:hypothetical protein
LALGNIGILVSGTQAFSEKFVDQYIFFKGLKLTHASHALRNNNCIPFGTECGQQLL